MLCNQGSLTVTLSNETKFPPMKLEICINYTFEDFQKKSRNKAERVGFEPTVPYGTRALQARALSQTMRPLRACQAAQIITWLIFLPLKFDKYICLIKEESVKWNGQSCKRREWRILDHKTLLMRKTDYKQALHLWQSLPGMGLSTADEEANINEFLDKNPTSCFVAIRNSRLIGTILGGSDGRRGYIYHLAVDKHEQGKGIGKELVILCLDALKNLGIQKCHIFVINDNAKGIAFWEKIGWHLRDDILVMSKEV